MITLSTWSLKCKSHQSRDVMCQNVWREICLAIRIHLLPLHPIPHILDFDASLKHLWVHGTKIAREKKRTDIDQTPRICKVQHRSSPVFSRWKDWKKEWEATLRTQEVFELRVTPFATFLPSLSSLSSKWKWLSAVSNSLRPHGL